MKKQILKLSMAIAVIALVFSSCKKGENDPFISLKSRTARLANTWELTSEDYTTTGSDGDSYTSTTKYAYANGIETRTTTFTIMGGNSTTSSSTSTFTKKYTFDKKGTYTLEVNDGEIETFEGNWVWLNKNKNVGLAGKEALMMSTTKDVDGSDTYNYSGKSNDFNKQWVLDKLSSKELVILFDYSYTDSDGNTSTMKGTMTYTKK